MQVVKNKNIEIIFLESGNKFKIEEIEIEVIWPDRKEIIQDNVLNNNSVVFKLKYNKFSILFTGDIEEIAEKEILKKYENNIETLKSSVLKVAHHGSKTSSNSEFLKYVNPSIALIGVGKENKFGHPNDEVLKRFNEMRDKNL